MGFDVANLLLSSKAGKKFQPTLRYIAPEFRLCKRIRKDIGCVFESFLRKAAAISRDFFLNKVFEIQG